MGSSCHGNFGNRRRSKPGGGAFGPTPGDDDGVLASATSPPFDAAERATDETSSLPPRMKSDNLSALLGLLLLLTPLEDDILE